MWGAKWVWLLKDNIRDSCGDGNIVYLDCINVNILLVITIIILKMLPLRKIDKDYTGSPCIIS